MNEGKKMERRENGESKGDEKDRVDKERMEGKRVSHEGKVRRKGRKRIGKKRGG